MSQFCKPQQNNVMATWFLNDNNNNNKVQGKQNGRE